jgi:hypothetical protein
LHRATGYHDPAAGNYRRKRGIKAMRDFIFLAGTVVFFVVAVAYTWACERLK